MKQELNKIIKNRFNKETKIWDNVHFNKYKDIISWEIFKRKDLTKKHLFKNYKNKKIKILEIGCGAGNNLYKTKNDKILQTQIQK
jgi:ubiquinone/menaquinone biosynthesis C-methylase UbiE